MEDPFPGPDSSPGPESQLSTATTRGTADAPASPSEVAEALELAATALAELEGVDLDPVEVQALADAVKAAEPGSLDAIAEVVLETLEVELSTVTINGAVAVPDPEAATASNDDDFDEEV
ncbi:MAG TPA: hypothetical protein VID05_07115, partial [Acidimicrobiales bacterium]